MALKFTEEQLEWLTARIPDAPRNPLGGRPPVDKRKALGGIFWMMDNGAKWKDLPREFGSKSAVHRWFQAWVRDRVFENLMREAGRCIEERDGFKLYECFIDGTFAKACGGGDGIGCTKAGKGVKIMVLVDGAVEMLNEAMDDAAREIDQLDVGEADDTDVRTAE